MKNILFIFLLLFIGTQSIAQEFNLEVSVSAPANMITDEKIFEQLEQELFEFFNSNTWTDDSFQEHERIRGSIQLNIKTELGAGNFTGEMIVQTSRPIYNSNVSTPVMTYIDKNVSLSYNGLTPIQQTKEGYIDNFSTTLSFFAYYMLGMDYDTFSPMGGSAHFDQAFSLFNALPSGLQRSDAGWNINDNRQQNRYFLIENVRSPKFKRFRDAIYTYHRQGLDVMASDFEKGRKSILDAIVDVGRVNNEVNNTILPRMFCDTKTREIVDVFIVAEKEDKTKVRNVMLQIDPTQSINYRDLRN